MKKITNVLKNIHFKEDFSYLLNNYSKNINDFIFFDIETTGFSYKNSMCYLIGAAYLSDIASKNKSTITNDIFCENDINNISLENKDNSCDNSQWLYTQWFATSPNEEADILKDFLAFISNYKYVISFNGERFDIPFINGRCDILNINSPLKDLINNSIDIFRIIQSLKALLRLENYKQKSIEEFLKIHRTDKYSGGELIKYYKNYVLSKDNTLLELLLLHNHDDIEGLINISPILNYLNIINHNYDLLDTKISDYIDYHGNLSYEVIFTLTLPCKLITPINYIKEPFLINIQDNTITIKAPIFSGNLKYFYPNYKDYYYIPSEDQAMHKSVASFIDKNYRQPAKASNCYIYKNGSFLMQYNNIISPSFKENYSDTHSFFEPNSEFINSPNKILEYIKDILNNILTVK